MTKIYVFCNGTFNTGDLIGVAIADDGSFLASHLSSNDYYVKFDMGVGSDRKHDVYRTHYPQGYQLEFVPDPPNHSGLLAALKKNKELHEAEVAKANKE